MLSGRCWFANVLCSGVHVLCYAPGDFVPTSYLPVLVMNCDYWIAGVDARSLRAMCEALFGAALCSCAMPCLELFCPVVELPALRVAELWLCGAGGVRSSC